MTTTQPNGTVWVVRGESVFGVCSTKEEGLRLAKHCMAHISFCHGDREWKQLTPPGADHHEWRGGHRYVDLEAWTLDEPYGGRFPAATGDDK